VAALIAPLFSAAVRALSFLSLSGQRRLGRWLGRLMWLAGIHEARITRINLRQCFPELDRAARRRLARQSLEHTAMLFTETGTTFHWPVARWRELAIEIQGASLIDRARQNNQGVLILVPHFGNWEFLAMMLGEYQVTALYAPPRIRSLEPVIRASRTRTGATLLPIDASGLRGFYQALAGGGVTVLLPDQVPDRGAGIYAEFFGIPTLTMTLAHRLIRRTGAVVLLGAAIREGDGFRVCFRELDGDIAAADPAKSAAAMNHAIEELARTDPAQYQWAYKRFKRPPPGTRNPYKRRR
jgi:Kdo2-lipid IVA lauroyltransferase/acyltransferase